MILSISKIFQRFLCTSRFGIIPGIIVKIKVSSKNKTHIARTLGKPEWAKNKIS